MHHFLGKAVLGSRYILGVFFLGLVAAIALFAVRFLLKVWDFAGRVLSAQDEDLLLDVLYLLDSVLVASLVITVIISSWDTLVDRIEDEADRERMNWVSRTGQGNLKIKLATSIVAISAIHLLQVFLKIESNEDRVVMWSMGVHAMFLLGVVVLTLADKFEGTSGGAAEDKEPPPAEERV